MSTVTGVESHNALVVADRYHAYIRKVFDWVHSKHPRMSREILLKLPVSLCNDTVGTNGIVPTMFDFVIKPRMPLSPYVLAGYLERMTASPQAQ